MKKIGYWIVAILVVIVLIFAVRFILGGPEDSWICQDGVWTKHGNPRKPAPMTGCAKENQNQATTTTTEIIYQNASSDLIRVELPSPDAVTGKEFSVIGEARGFWFFEASFPVQVLDKDGKVLATAIAEAQPDPVTGEINWMTENFVPFKADLKVPESYIGRATLILKKDNPSGLPENDASISFPINIEY